MNTITPTISQMRMLASIRGQQWLMRPDSIQEFALAALDVPEKANSLNISMEDFFELRPETVMDADGIAHIYIYAALVDSCPPIYEKLGLATCYCTIEEEIEESIEIGAKAILFHINSPGGTVSGNVEIASMIADLELPTAAHCYGLACSAAYKLAAGCDVIIATESAQVGNIGTILSWADCTEFWRQNGVEFKAMTNAGADLKSTFHLEPDSTQLAFLQQSIDEAGQQFREHVTAGRTAAGATLDDEVWRAGWYSGQRAGSLGLIDGIGTAEDARQYLISRLS